ncbi:MAG: tRNA lysidine(34) synthetase TilS [Bacteroidales bacterium]|nr:tRNA lysidine(34) synthetase TilS [Bacteroidales bacterium]MCL2133739.1 tRNA lysidine(34) synthetase TilS [Bacteroidales bacterium]
MYRKFLQYNQKQGLFSPHDNILLAVSGGMDSMVLARLFLRSGQIFGIAHCNFSLRGKESDEDQAFVQEWAAQHNIPFHTICFDTNEYAVQHKLSTQMAARELRYNWFSSLVEQHGYTKIAVAHHANDLTETLLLNFTRGTGLKGLCSMAPANGNIIRPLLFAQRLEVQKYAKENDISFREDSSNASDDYARNYIRHHIIPKLESLNPSLIETLLHNSRYFSQAQSLISKIAREEFEKCCDFINNELYIDIPTLAASGTPGLFLHEWLQEYGFNSRQVDDIVIALEGQAGKRFHSASHKLIKDRDKLIVIEHCRATMHCVSTALSFDQFPYLPAMSIPQDKNTAWLDADKLQLPLITRLWKKGDTFVPLGMKGKKKVSDFFIDKKIPLHHKEKQLVLLSGKDIVWLVGQRIDDRYKTTSATKNIYQIRWNENLTG